VSACELYEGALLAKNREKVLPKVEGLLSRLEILPADIVAANFFGRIAAELSRKGKTPPDFDALIAAIAMANNENVVTRDAHFAEIRGLAVKRW